MNITIKTVLHSKQRYNTVGDWFFNKKGDLTIVVSKTGNWREEVLVAIHELVEVVLCKDRNITEEKVTEFDLNHLESEEPGFEHDSPYYKEHQFADAIERLVANQLNVNWEYYSNTLDSL